ncbi:hypothetical protein [Actinacidiphila oryziradicis]|uniref:Uncharacterized protein n=1 Tax=Actinacidiphila oryziradicis TaxID=2571141 RepID=A0A4U0RMQ1_9ACTN|nr:hypothetical protein [Actinacidiphila oryziradicis]TJZ97131.1 hypothetical protein FCI23_49900 [Actinacidiphila oryziradicis]
MTWQAGRNEPYDEDEAIVMPCLAMSPAQRRAAAATAIDNVIGLDPYGQPGLSEDYEDGPIVISDGVTTTVIVPGPAG